MKTNKKKFLEFFEIRWNFKWIKFWKPTKKIFWNFLKFFEILNELNFEKQTTKFFENFFNFKWIKFWKTNKFFFFRKAKSDVTCTQKCPEIARRLPVRNARNKRRTRTPHPTPLDVNKQSLRDAPNHQIQAKFFSQKSCRNSTSWHSNFMQMSRSLNQKIPKKICFKKSLKREQIKWHEGVGEVEIKFLKNLKKSFYF